MGIHPTEGYIVWQVPDEIPETPPTATIVVTDAKGARTTQLITFLVQPDTLAPVVQFHLVDSNGRTLSPKDELYTDRDYSVVIDIDDNADLSEVDYDPETSGDFAGLEVGRIVVSDTAAKENIPGGPVPVTLPLQYGHSEGPIFNLNNGLVYIDIEVVDKAGNKTTTQLVYHATDPDTTYHAKIESPLGTEPISEQTDVYGTVHGPSPDDTYILKLYSMEDPTDFVELRSDTAPGSASTPIGKIDPTLYKSGFYRLVLLLLCDCEDGPEVQAADGALSRFATTHVRPVWTCRLQTYKRIWAESTFRLCAATARRRSKRTLRWG